MPRERPLSDPAARPALEERAADWLARRDAGLSREEQAQFSRWLEADPRHAAALAEVEAAWTRLTRPQLTGHADEALRLLAIRQQQRRQRRQRGILSVAGLAAAAAFALMLWPASEPLVESPLLAANAAILQPASQTLPDGSVVELNAGAEIRVEFSASTRALRLLQGEAHFAVVKDPDRPFVVTAGHVDVRAVGTAFVVRLQSEEVAIVVTEGQVAVEPTAPPHADEAAALPRPDPILLSARKRMVWPAAVPSPEPPPVETIAAGDLERTLAWRQRRIEFSGTPLAEAVASFNRENPHLQLVLAEPGLAELRVSGVFRADQPAGFARLLEASFGLRAMPEAEQRIELRKVR